jgi:predicted permease
VRINGLAATIVGVMPEGMRFFDNADVWLPFVPVPATGDGESPTVTFDVFGRLREHVSRDAARAELTAIAQRSVTRADVDPARTSARVEPIAVAGNARTIFPTVMAVGALVLLIACANVANLLLSRTPYRAREIALRIALGASRGRVARQLLLESLVLAVLGGVIGLLLAGTAINAFEAALRDSGKPFWLVFRTDPAVVAYVAALSGLTCVIFGLAPALQASALRSHEVLKDGGRGTSDSPRIRWFSSALVVVQLSLTIVLLGGAGLVIRGFFTLYSIDPGIRTDGLSVMQFELLGQRYATPDARRMFFERVQTRLASVAGVEASALTTAVPPFDGGERLVEIDEAGPARPPRFSSTVTIGPEFFRTVDRPVLRGRAFAGRDGVTGTETVIVNEEFVERFFAGADALGRRIRFTTRNARAGESTDVWRTIVGISAPIRHGSRQDAYRGSVVYLPYRQDAPANVSLLVRSRLPLDALGDTVRREVQAEDATVPVIGIQTLAQAIAADRWAHRIFGGLFAMLALASLVLSGVGLYAVMAYAVSRRRQEIGIRMAVGAGRGDVSWMIVRRALVQLAIGLPLGLAGALALGVVLESLLVEMSPADPVTLAAVVLVSTLVALAACVVPARRATRLDPVAALRD